MEEDENDGLCDAAVNLGRHRWRLAINIGKYIIPSPLRAKACRASSPGMSISENIRQTIHNYYEV